MTQYAERALNKIETTFNEVESSGSVRGGVSGLIEPLNFQYLSINGFLEPNCTKNHFLNHLVIQNPKGDIVRLPSSVVILNQNLNLPITQP